MPSTECTLLQIVSKLPGFFKELFPNGVPLPPEGCKYHFFISKHEELGKAVAEILYHELTRLGFKVLLFCLPSNHFASP